MRTLMLAILGLLALPASALAESVEFHFKPTILDCYVETMNQPMNCQWVIPSEYDTVILPIEKLAEVNSTEVWQGHWQETVMAEGVFFTYTIHLLKTVEKPTGATHFEIQFGIRNTANTNYFSIQVETDRLENLGQVKVEGASVVDRLIERYPHLEYGSKN